MTSNIYMLAGGLAIFIFLITAFLQWASIEDSIPNLVVSWIVNAYLGWRYPIKSADGQNTIPGCPYVYPNGQGNMEKFYNDMSKKWRSDYGPIYRIWNGTRPEVIVGCPEDIKGIFRDSGEHLKAPDMNAGWVVGELMGKCLGLANQSDWSRILAAMAGPFHQRAASEYIDLMEKRVKKAMAELESKKDQLGQNGMVINPANEFLYLPLFILGDILYGSLDKEMEEDLRSIALLRDQLWKEGMSGGLARYAIGRFVPGGRRRMLLSFHRRWKSFNDRAYKRAQDSGPANAPVISMYRSVSEGALTETELLHTLDEMIFVNLDVTVGNFSWNPVFLAVHPEFQQKIREEIQQARRGGEGALGSWKAYLSSTSTLLMSSILESSRLKPMASFAVPQSCPSERVVGGFVIPAHTEIVVDTGALNVENPAWGADRHEYNPERFIGKNAVSWRYRFWRFGFGPRQCLGRHVVDIMLKTLLAEIVENYTLTPGWEERNKEHSEWAKDPEVWLNLAIQPTVWKKREMHV